MMQLGTLKRWTMSVKKEHSLLRPDAGDRTGLDPLGKFVNGDEQVGEVASCPFQGSN
jgi:hypothetical protein